jgi:hypothetical protein
MKENKNESQKYMDFLDPAMAGYGYRLREPEDMVDANCVLDLMFPSGSKLEGASRCSLWIGVDGKDPIEIAGDCDRSRPMVASFLLPDDVLENLSNCMMVSAFKFSTPRWEMDVKMAEPIKAMAQYARARFVDKMKTPRDEWDFCVDRLLGALRVELEECALRDPSLKHLVMSSLQSPSRLTNSIVNILLKR